MRIIAGKFRGKALLSPTDESIRPTSDRAREAMFNILASRIGVHLDGLKVLDLFAGTGALGIEALSRGAGSACFVDNDAAAVKAIKANLAAFSAAGDVRQSPVASLGTAVRAHHLVFLDAPYGLGLADPALIHLHARGWIAPGAIISVETAAADKLACEWELLVERRFGKALVRLLRAPA